MSRWRAHSGPSLTATGQPGAGAAEVYPQISQI